MLVIDRLCYGKCQAGCAVISNKVFLWECKLPVPSLSTIWPAVPFSKAFWGSIFSWRRGGKGSQPLFSGSLHLALGDTADAK